MTSASIVDDKEGRNAMAEHRFRKNNITYIIPDDELFEKLINDEAFIDEYGRLMNKKPHRVLKELKHYVERQPAVQQRPPEPRPVPARRSSPVMDYLKETAQDKAMEVGERIIDRAVDALFFEVLPYVWHEQIVPLYHHAKDALTSKESKTASTLPNEKAAEVAIVNPEAGTRMTQQEVDAEKRRVLYHWIGMLSSLKKLHDAGEIDSDSILEQLTNPVMLERVNGALSNNPNLLETVRYIELQDLLGRDLYKEKQLIPISAAEITTIAATYGYERKNVDTEDNHYGRTDNDV